MKWPRVVAARLWRALVAALLLLTLGTGTASAHDVLLSSDPADGSVLATAPTKVTLTFDQPVQNFQPVVSLTGPDGQSHRSSSVDIQGSVVTAPVSLTGPGAYIAAYRVVSADGHPVTGEIRFTLAGAGVSIPASTSVTAANSQSTGLSGWLWIGLAVALILVAMAAVLLIRRPKPEAASADPRRTKS